MMREMKFAVLILIAASAAAVTTNYLRAGTRKFVPWMGRELPSRPPQKPVLPEGAHAAPGSAQPVAHGDHTHDDSEYISLADVVQHLQNGDAVFVDARKPEEYAQGHLLGAVNLPSTRAYELMDVVLSIAPVDHLVIVYCGGGQCEASHEVAHALTDAGGLKNVKIFHEGWDGVMSPATGAPFQAFVVVGENPS